MNAHAHMSGQIPGQVPTQAGPQVSGSARQINNTLASQMQNMGTRTMDTELLNGRRAMQNKIFTFLSRRAASDTNLDRLPALTRNLEDHLFREAKSREDYLNLVREQPDIRLSSILNNFIQTQLSSHRITSSSSLSTMIPTPGVAQNGSTNFVENSSISASGPGVVRQTTTDIGSISTASTGIGNNNFNASDGLFSNGCKHQSINGGFGSGGISLMSSMSSANLPRQIPQMIPTPGFTNPQTVPLSSDSSNVADFLNNESTVVLTSQQQKKYVGNPNSQIIHSLGGQNGTGMKSNMQQKASSYGFSNGLTNAGLGLIGSNMQPNGPGISEGFLSTTSYMQPHFDQQHHQSRISTSLSQHMLSIVDDSYPMKAADMAGSETLRSPSSSALSHMNKLNNGNLHVISRTNSGILNHHASLLSMQQPSHIRPNILARQQKMNFQSSQSTNDHQLQDQQHTKQFQHQPNQTYSQFVQNHLQLQQQGPLDQQFLLNNDKLRQSLVTPDFGDQLMPRSTIVTQSESLLSQATPEIHLSELQSQYPLNITAEDQSKRAQFLSHLPVSRELHAPILEGSEQLLDSHQKSHEFVNKVGSISSRSPTEELLQGQPQSMHSSQLPGNPSSEQLLKEELHQRLTGQDEAQRPHIFPDRFITSSDANSVSQFTRGMSHVPEDSRKQSQLFKQGSWLLFLIHARKCPAPKGQCKAAYCWKAQELLMHMDSCPINTNCAYPRCSVAKGLFLHVRSCKAVNCPFCGFVRDYVKANSKPRARPLSDTGFLSETKIDREGTKTDAKPIETSDDRQTLSKRMKVQHMLTSLFPKSENTAVCVPSGNLSYGIQEVQTLDCEQSDMKISAKTEVNDGNVDQSVGSGQENLSVFKSNVDVNGSAAECEVDPVSSNYVYCHVKLENTVIEKEMDKASTEVKPEANDLTSDQISAGKSGKPKIKGVSLTELFTPEQIREHIIGLRQWVGQSKAKAEKNQAMECSMSENSCQLCAVEKLTFEPPPIYCSPCGARIKRNAMYYTIGTGETRHYFCIPCYNEARGDTIEVDGSGFPKAKLEKKRNDEETEEWWVQCDKCELWQHQICALFNGRRNDGGQAEYTCPNCYIQEVEGGERKPLPQNAVLGAKDLPRTILSDHIEQRLFRRLKQERLERARHLGKSYDEVQGADGLVVRVVSSVDKKLEVKQRFLETFQEENYPKEYPYKSKAILLFQKIEGVEVCLFGMYVQEFGSECAFPNQRRVYLSYLDSVKYFRPEIKTITGEALRTFVYHEILIGYLEYCKNRGFTSCYIWACPPLKGEDYILYCHPEIQKTPKSDKLREWYLSMLRKAAKENIVVELTNLYDHFFVPMGECKAKVTAARLPYFDGDYWPGAAEDMINQLRQEEDGRKQQKKGKTKKTLTKRALKAAGQTDLSGNASKDALLMQKLGETICTMKEDFIMVHLQHCCNHCCMLMVSGKRWVCNQCKNFQLCDKCNESEQGREERDRHPIHAREKHGFHPVEITDVATATKDKDEILESEFFDTRQAFLSLCQGNHYQYDTLRRAKHSSMMVLYHLHNPTAPAFVTTCMVCHHDIETGQGWRCESCPDFDICNACHQKGSGNDHPHKLTNHPSLAERDAQNKEARQKRVLQLRKMLDLLVHASQCRFPHCQYPNCRKVKGLFRHGIQCKTRASGGCVLCKKMWYLLQIHARACKESECTVPRCRDLKDHQKRLQQQSDSRRRAAVMEMMRQRAAEVAGNSG